MKTLGICAMMALAALSVAPALADDASYSKAIALAASDSEASIDEIAYTLYLAVKENPEQASGMLATVLDQRTDWSSKEVYSLFTAVMMAHPDLTTPVKEHVQGTDGTGEGAPAGGAAGAADAQPAAPSELPTLSDDIKGTVLGELILVIYGAELSEGVASAVVDAAGFANSVTEPAPSASGESEGADEGATTESSDAASSDAASSDAAGSDAAVSDAAGESSAPAMGSINDMAQMNQSVISGSLGGGTVTEEVKEPAINPPSDDDYQTPGPSSPQGGGMN